MIASENPYQIGVTTGAFCKTEAVSTLQALLKQRRRWFLGFVTNEVCMLTDIRVWKRYPFLCVVRLAQDSIRTTGLFFFTVLVALLTTSQEAHDLPMGFIAIAVGLNWVLMAYFAAALGRWKLLLYPILFVVRSTLKCFSDATITNTNPQLGPFFDWLYIVYGVLTAGRRTWGGPRADAAQADVLITPQAAIEYALETGDDLNVVPETFRRAAKSRRRGLRAKSSRVSLQPSQRFEGRFMSNYREKRQFPSGNSDDFNGARADTGTAHPLARHSPMRPRSTQTSRHSIDSTNSLFVDFRQSVHLPRHAESLDRLTVTDHQRPASISRPNSRDASSSRAHPPRANSALTSLRLSQPHPEFPPRIKLRNSFNSLSSRANLLSQDHLQLMEDQRTSVTEADVAQPRIRDHDVDESASLMTVAASDTGIPLTRLPRAEKNR